jgi:hypothetical protein
MRFLSKRNSLLMTGVVALSLMSGAHVANAALVNIAADLLQSESGLGNYEGTLDYDPTLFKLTVSLTNTSPVANGGRLTGFLFNNPGNQISTVSLSAGDPDFQLVGGPSFNNSAAGNPFGGFDIGAALGGNFLGGGSPTPGLGVGASASFVFTFTGTNLGTLTTQSFVNTLSNNPASGKNPQFFLARFRGFLDGGSDKSPGKDTTNVIPEPAFYQMSGLLLLGGTGLFLRIRRRQSNV